MTTTITATDAARRFSDLLNRVRYRGESFRIVRSGEEVAQLTAAAPRPETSLRALLSRLETERTEDPEFADELEKDPGEATDRGRRSLGLLIDTSVFIQIERSRAAPESLLESVGDQSVFLSAISASELLHGVHRADTAVRRGRRERFVESIFSQVPVLPFDMEIARVHSRLWADLSARGQMIGAHDLLIAATAVAHEHAVITENVREFGRVPDLDLEVWSRSA